VWHQDLTIAVREKREAEGFGPWSFKDGVAHVQPPVRVLEQMLTLRLHLDDCDENNGPLRVLRGSHQSGKLSSSEIAEWRAQQAEEVCTSPRGGALLMRPLLLHASSQAKTPRHRRVLHLEWANGKLSDGLRWHSQK
jgi:ectoine hydroxylase-related dioxygenase (phytanoyl-CoA dioxygenase family)